MYLYLPACNLRENNLFISRYHFRYDLCLPSGVTCMCFTFVTLFNLEVFVIRIPFAVNGRNLSVKLLIIRELCSIF